jgi:hypothetical protein
VSQIAAGSAQHGFGVGSTTDQPRQRDDFVLRRPMIAAYRVGVALDLDVDRITESKALVAELVDEFGFEHSLGSVNVANGFEEAEREEGVDRGEHGTSRKGRRAR